MVVLLVGISAYSLVVLRESPSESVRRTVSAAEAAAKANLRALLRGLQAILVVGLGLAAWDLFQPGDGQTALLEFLIYSFAIAVLQLVASLCMLVLVGGWRKDTNTVHTQTTKVVPTSSVPLKQVFAVNVEIAKPIANSFPDSSS